MMEDEQETCERVCDELRGESAARSPQPAGGQAATIGLERRTELLASLGRACAVATSPKEGYYLGIVVF